MQSTMLSNKLSASTVAVAARPSRQRVVKTMAVFDTEEKKANKTTSGVGTKTRNLQMSGAECESVCCCLIQHRPARVVIARASTLPNGDRQFATRILACGPAVLPGLRRPLLTLCMQA